VHTATPGDYIHFPLFGLSTTREHIKAGFTYLLSPTFRSPLSLRAYLATDIAGHDVVLGVPPEYFAKAVQHYLHCKAKSSKPTTLCALVDTRHHLFPKWGQLLYGMRKIQGPKNSGYSFWVDDSEPEKTISSIQNMGKTSCSMVFQGYLSGSPAITLMDTGASHCFLDLSFAQQNNFALHPTKTSVALADGALSNVVLKTAPLKMKIGSHFSTTIFYVLDMQRQYDLILGDNWQTKHDAILHIKDKSCELRQNNRRYKIFSIDQAQQKQNSQHTLLNAAQVCRLYKNSANIRDFQITVQDAKGDNTSKPSVEVQHLLHEFNELTQQRTSLPPYAQYCAYHSFGTISQTSVSTNLPAESVGAS